MEWETIDREQIRDIMEGREPQPPKVCCRKSCDDL
jgi:cell division protease FtsH